MGRSSTQAIRWRKSVAWMPRLTLRQTHMAHPSSAGASSSHPIHSSRLEFATVPHRGASVSHSRIPFQLKDLRFSLAAVGAYSVPVGCKRATRVSGKVLERRGKRSATVESRPSLSNVRSILTTAGETVKHVGEGRAVGRARSGAVSVMPLVTFGDGRDERRRLPGFWGETLANDLVAHYKRGK